MPFHKALGYKKKFVHNTYVGFFIELRDYCEKARDCREYAYICNRNLCECAEGYKSDEKNRTCIGGRYLLMFHFKTFGEKKMHGNYC